MSDKQPSKEARNWYYANMRDRDLPREPSDNLLAALDAFAAEAVKERDDKIARLEAKIIRISNALEQLR